MLERMNRELKDEELEDVNGGASLSLYTTPFEMPDEPQLSNLKASIRKNQCRCRRNDLSDQELNVIIEQYILPGYAGYPCPRCGRVMDTKHFAYVIYGSCTI